MRCNHSLTQTTSSLPLKILGYRGSAVSLLSNYTISWFALHPFSRILTLFLTNEHRDCLLAKSVSMLVCLRRLPACNDRLLMVRLTSCSVNITLPGCHLLGMLMQAHQLRPMFFKHSFALPIPTRNVLAEQLTLAN